jgi:hypothetical protein
MGCDISYEVDFEVDKVRWRKGDSTYNSEESKQKDKVGMLFKMMIVSILYTVKRTNDKDVSGV